MIYLRVYKIDMEAGSLEADLAVERKNPWTARSRSRLQAEGAAEAFLASDVS